MARKGEALDAPTLNLAGEAVRQPPDATVASGPFGKSTLSSGLAASRGSDDRSELAFGDQEVQALQRLHLDAVTAVDAHHLIAHDERAGAVVAVPLGDADMQVPAPPDLRARRLPGGAQRPGRGRARYEFALLPSQRRSHRSTTPRPAMTGRRGAWQRPRPALPRSATPQRSAWRP